MIIDDNIDHRNNIDKILDQHIIEFISVFPHLPDKIVLHFHQIGNNFLTKFDPQDTVTQQGHFEEI